MAGTVKAGKSVKSVSPRARQLADRIRVIVAEMLETRVKDPRLGFVTITEARITGDLREATVFYTVLGSPLEQAASTAALTSATGILRSEVGKRTGLKHTPSLTFIPDAVPENARHIEDLLSAAREQDERVAKVATGKTYAGEADPYRHDDDLDDLDDLDDPDDPDAEHAENVENVENVEDGEDDEDDANGDGGGVSGDGRRGSTVFADPDDPEPAGP